MSNGRMIHIALIGLVMLIGLTGCNRVKPQGAANQAEMDSTQLKLMEMNLLLAFDADRLLVDSVQASAAPYVMDQRGFWYCRMEQTDGLEVKQGMRVDYSARICDLASGALLEDRTEEVEVGKRETLRAIDMCFPEMREGEIFTLLVPYYNAYGRDGNEYIEPLTNVRIELRINAITKI